MTRFLVLLLFLVGCAAPAPPRPTEAERWMIYQQQVMAALRSVEAWCRTQPDPRACLVGALGVLSRPVVLPQDPPPPQTIIIQQPRPPGRRYQGPRDIWGVPRVPGLVPVYPVE